jgi:uncharacterized protein (TIGR02270 family)
MVIAVIRDLVEQYVEQTAFLWWQRHAALKGAAYDLAALAEHDERLAAHLEGLHASGPTAWHVALAALQERCQAGEAFTATVLCLEVGDIEGLYAILKLAETAPAAVAGVISALGWVAPASLRSVVHELMRTSLPIYRFIGVSACALHRVDLRGAWPDLISDPDARVRARALRLAGELGALHCKDPCAIQMTQDDDASCRHWAAWSAVLLGDRQAGFDGLMEMAAAQPDGPALELVLLALPPEQAHAWLKRLAGQGLDLRTLLRGSAYVGDPAYVPWFLNQMKQPATARLAGESFSLITGANLRDRPLAGSAPDDLALGPTDDPEDGDVSMEQDHDLPWPNVEAVSQWWTAHREYLPVGTRLLQGAPATREHLVAVLGGGTQRARSIAARALALLTPGQPLFDVGAPAMRQQAILTGWGGGG